MTTAELLQEYRDAKLEMQPSLDALKEMETKLKQRILEEGEDVEIDGATATIKQPYERKSWDGKKLEGYAAAHPEVLDFVKVSKVKETVAIKVTA